MCVCVCVGGGGGVPISIPYQNELTAHNIKSTHSYVHGTEKIQIWN